MRVAIAQEDCRRMIRLLAETASIAGGHAEKKRFLMRGLCRLVEGDCWLWTLACQRTPGEAQVYVGFMHGGFSKDRFAHFLEAIAHPLMGSAVEAYYTAVAERQSHVTMLRREVDPNGIALRDGPRELWEKANIGDLIFSGCPLDESSMSSIGIYRRLNGDAFTDREKNIAHIVLREVPWLHTSGWPEDRGATVPHLSPRQRTVLNLLLDGMSRKQIADHLDISENTVAGYARDVYRHFSVNSQAELMRKFLSACEAQ